MKIDTYNMIRIGIMIVLGLSLILLGLKSANAEGLSGPYISGNLGLAVLPDFKYTINGGSTKYDYINHNLGFGASFAGGYKKERFRIELEVASSMVTHKEEYLDGGPLLPDMTLTGNTSIITVMGNVYLEFFDSEASTLVPYIGVGSGYVRLSTKKTLELFGVSTDQKINNNLLGAQGIVGLKYNMDEKSAITFQWKGLITQGPTFKIPGTTDLKYDAFYTNTFAVGVLYRF